VRRIRQNAVIAILVTLLVLFNACYNYNNPVDREAANYQGFITVATVEEVVPNLADGQDLVFLEINVLMCLTADRYRFQVTDSKGSYSSPMYDAEQSSNLFDFSSVNLESGTYYCRTMARDTNGTWGNWSREVPFTAVVDLGTIVPEDSGWTEDTTPLLDWINVEGAVSYRVRYADSSSGLAIAPVHDVTESEYNITVEQTSNISVYWQVRVVNGAGVSTAWNVEKSFWILPAIGTSYGGGIVFYLDGKGGGLIAAESDQGTDNVWGGYGTSVGVTLTAVGKGAANTAAIVARYGDTEPYEGKTDYAAKLCADLELNGYTDWFLPSMDELDLMHGQKEVIGGFSDTGTGYWSSTEWYSDKNEAWRQYFDDSGFIAQSYKISTHLVRAIRAF